MADTTTTSSTDLLTALQQQLASMGQVPQADTTPVDRSVGSLLGEAIGGGDPTGMMSPAQREAAGNRSLLNFGMGMLAASGYHPVRTTLGEAFAQGLQGAGQSEAASAEAAYNMLGQRQALAMKQQEMRLAALKEAVPLLQLQATAGLPNPLLAGSGGGTALPGTTPGTSLAAVARNPSIGTAGQQANNPGNVMADSGAPFGATGYIPVSGGRKVAVYPDLTTGIAANAANLNSYASKGINTVADAVRTWVGDPKADLTSYTNDVSRALGVKPTDTIDLSNPATQKAFILAQQPHESGKLWLTPDAVDKGVALAQTWRTRPPQPATGPVAAPATTTPPVAPAPPGRLPVPAGTVVTAGPGAGSPPAPAPAVQPPPTTALQTPTTPAPAPAPAAPAQPDTRPDADLTFAEYRARHAWQPTAEEQGRWQITVTPQQIADAQAAKQTAAIELQRLRLNPQADTSKAVQAYNTANDNLAKLQQQAQSDTQKAQQDWYAKQDQILQQNYQAAKQQAAQVALEQQKGQQALEQEKVKAGYTMHQQQQQADMEEGKTFLQQADQQASSANDMRNLLALIGPNVKSLPSGMVAQVLSDHPDLVNYLRGTGVISGDQADAVQLIRGLTQYASTMMRPKGTGALRTPEMTAFQAVMPTLLESDAGRQKALAFLNAYNDRIVQEADFAHQYFKRQAPDQTPGAAPGAQAPAYNIDGLWGAAAKPVEQGGLGDVIPHYHGDMNDGAAYQQWLQSQRSGRPYWGYKRGADGKLVETLQVAP